MHRQSLRDALERARRLCLEAEVRLEADADVQEEGVSRWTWISARLWDGYSDLAELGARLPEQERATAEPEEISPEALKRALEAALAAASAASRAETARIAALEGEAVSGQPAPERISDEQAKHTRHLMRALWHGTEIANALDSHA